MKRNYLLVIIFVLFLILPSGCGGGTPTVPIITTQTPVIQPTPTGTPVNQVVSTLTETETKKVTISAKDGGSVTEGDMEIDIPANDLGQDSSVEIARVTINGQNRSNKDNISTAYEISTGDKSEEIELKEPARVILKNVNSDQRPVLYDGDNWIPIDDYTYDPNTKELSIWINFIEGDSDTYTEGGGEESEIEAPVVIALNNKIDYQYDFISDSKEFKVFYNDSSDEAYAKSVASTIDEAYNYYKGLGYNAPVKSLVNKKEDTSNYIYTYIYNTPGSRYDKSVGVAWTLGYMGFNRRIMDMTDPRYKSTCYHELLHLIQYSYSGNRSRYQSWFSESMCTAMQYYAINRPQGMYDVSNGGRWYMDLFWYETFNEDSDKSTNNYNKYVIWSYLVNKSDGKLFHEIMTNLLPKDHTNPEALNSAFQKKFSKSLPTLMNDMIEDYYIKGTFFNKNYFYKLSNRPVNQPYSDIINRDSITPKASITSYSISPLSMRYVCYTSSSFKGTFELNFDSMSSNCKIKIYPMKYNNGSYEVSAPDEIKGTAEVTKKYTLGTDITELFVLIENTSMNSDAKATLTTLTL